MNIYIDESGSINNKSKHSPYFVIALLHVTNKEGLSRAYKRFVTKNIKRLKELDAKKNGSKMFLNGTFKELKGSVFDFEMKNSFIDFFIQKKYFNVFYIKVQNSELSNKICENTARTFNYVLKNAVENFITEGYFPNEDYHLQLDERNEKTEAKYFLEQYLNTELTSNGTTDKSFTVHYFDSACNKSVQIADVFSNIFYSHLQTGNYTDKIQDLQKKQILQSIYTFPEDFNKKKKP